MKIYKCPKCGREYDWENKATPICSTHLCNDYLETIESDTFNPLINIKESKNKIQKYEKRKEQLLEKYKCVREYQRLKQEIFIEENNIEQEVK